MYAFDYQRPQSTAEAAKLGNADNRFLAGGQSLIQSMRLRLASAAQLVDLGGLADLKGIKVDGDGVTIGAMTTHAAVASSAEVKKAIPGLADLAGHIGDPMVRSMGTIGGSLANADPAACYPAAVLALGATIRTTRRTIEADDFFKGLFETALDDGELITAVTFPVPKQAAYVKYRQPASRFALVGVMVANGPKGVRCGVTGAKTHAFRCAEIEQALSGSFKAKALDGLKLAATDMNADLHGSPEYRAAMVVVMARRAVEAATRA
jgi:carbon-monoxide dehydrogenase medium subunit